MSLKYEPPSEQPTTQRDTPPYLRRIVSCITQLKCQGPPRTCRARKEEEEEEETPSEGSAQRSTPPHFSSSPSYLSRSSLELSDTRVYEPETRALLGPASHLCEGAALRSRLATL